MPLLPLLADVTHGEWCRLVKKPPMPSMATKKKPPSEITKKKPSVIAKKKPSVITEKKPSVITEKKPSVITKKKPSVITKKKPSVITKKKPSAVITTKKLSMNTKNSSMPSRDSRVLGLDVQQRRGQEALPISEPPDSADPRKGRGGIPEDPSGDEEAFLKIAQETDKEKQHCMYCGAARREQGAVRCEACGIHN